MKLARRFALLVLVSMSSFAEAQCPASKELAVSTFEEHLEDPEYTDGWGTVGDATGIVHLTEEDEHGGYIRASDQASGQGQNWFWVAPPAKFICHGLKAYGGTLSFYLRLKYEDDRQVTSTAGDVILIASSGIRIVLAMPQEIPPND